MEVTESGIVTEVRFVPPNASSPMEVKPSGMITEQVAKVSLHVVVSVFVAMALVYTPVASWRPLRLLAAAQAMMQREIR